MHKAKAFYVLCTSVYVFFAGLLLILPANGIQLVAIVVVLISFVFVIFFYRQSRSGIDNQNYLYSALFEQNTDAIFWVDFDGKIIRVNQQACDLLGYTREEFPHLKMPDIIVGAEVAHARQSLEKLLKGEQVPIYERTMRRKDGELRFVEINIQMVYDAQEKPVCIQSVMRDISLRKQNEEALTNSEQRLSTLVRALPDSTFIIDIEGRYHAVLKSDYDTDYPLKNYDGERAGGMIQDYYPAAHATLCLQKIRETTDSQEAQIFEYPCPFRGDPYRYVTYIIPYPDPQSEHPLVFWVTRDITDRVLAEQNRLELALEKEKLHVLQDFVNGIAHDLKTPLTVIAVSMDLLGRMTDPERQKNRVAVMQRQIDLISQMLEDMQAIVHLDIIPQLEYEPFDLGLMMQEIVDDLQYNADQKQIKLSFQKSGDATTIEGSKTQLRRALNNLVDNAVKYTRQPGMVDIKMFYDERFMYLDIMDTGIGIDAHDIEHIFDRFVRGNNARSFTSGTGLGLSIAKRIIDGHSGQVTVESKVDHGTTFHIQLPKQTTPEPLP